MSAAIYLSPKYVPTKHSIARREELASIVRILLKSAGACRSGEVTAGACKKSPLSRTEKRVGQKGLFGKRKCLFRTVVDPASFSSAGSRRRESAKVR